MAGLASTGDSEADMKTVGRPTVELAMGSTQVEIEWTSLVRNLGMGIYNCWAKHRRMIELC